MRRMFCIGLMVAAFFAATAVQSREISDIEKWFLEAYGNDALKRTVHLKFGGTLANLLTRFGTAHYLDKYDAVTIERIDHVGIQVYEFRQRPKRRIPGMVQQRLQTAAWELLLNVLDDNEHVQIYLRSGKHGGTGLLLIAQDEKELVSLRLEGRFRLNPVQP